VVHIDFESFGASVPHEIILQLLTELYFAPELVQLVTKYLDAPVMTSEGQVHRLGRGLINGIHMSRFLGEVLLSMLDLYVAHQSGIRMTRIFDDLWLWDTSASRMQRAIQAIKTFADASGLRFNLAKTGYLCCPGAEYSKQRPDFGLPPNPIGFSFTELAPNGDLFPVPAKIDIFARYMKEDLDDAAQHSVIEWAKRFNKYVAFFESGWGPFATVLGGTTLIQKRHEALDQLIAIVLASSADAPTADHGFQLAQYVERLIKSRSYGQHFFGSISVPWLFMPITAGGLGLINPYIVLVHHRANFSDPDFSYYHFGVLAERREYDARQQAYDRETAAAQASFAASSKKAPPRPPFRTFEDLGAKRYYEAREYLRSLTDQMKVRSQPYPPPTTTCCFAGEVDYNKNYQDFIDRGVRMFEGRFGTLSVYHTYIVYRYLPMLRREFGRIAFLDTSLIPYDLIITTLTRGMDDPLIDDLANKRVISHR
jgi:hypothetical protein